MLPRTWPGAVAILAVGTLILSACSTFFSPPTPSMAPVEPPSSIPIPIATATDQRAATATQTEVAIATPVPTQPVIAYFEPGAEVEIRSIQMIGPGTGWGLARGSASEDHVLKSSDGGQTWQDVTPPEPPIQSPAEDSATATFFLDYQTGWVAYFVNGAEPLSVEVHFWHTSDGGRSWDRGGGVDPTDYPEAPPILIFSDSAVGWLLLDHFVGMGHHAFTLLRTQDGGRTWRRLAGAPDSESLCHHTGLSFSDASSGWMTGECPFELGEGVFLEVSEDGGVNWQTLTLPPPSQSPDLFRTALLCSTRSPHLFGPETGMLVVTCSPAGAAGAPEQSFVYTTTDGGTSWLTSGFPGGELYLLDPGHGWALSKDLYWTEDGGANWTQIKTVEWEGQFSFVSAQLGWAVARTEGEIGLVRTTDGGRTWQLLEPTISP